MPHFRDEHIDGEYNRPLSERILSPTEEEKEKLKMLIEKYSNQKLSKINNPTHPVVLEIYLNTTVGLVAIVANDRTFSAGDTIIINNKYYQIKSFLFPTSPVESEIVGLILSNDDEH